MRAKGPNKLINRMKISSHSSMGGFILIWTIIFLSSASLGWCAANGNTFTQNTPKFSFNFQNEPFKNVCKSISRATGYEIKFNDNFANLPITAVFEEATAFGALKKVLRIHNHSLVLNEENHLIEVFIIPNGNSSADKRVAALPTQNQESGTETYPEEMDQRMENDDSAATEAIEAYAQEYITQTTAGKEADTIEAADENTYAEEYIRRSKVDEPVSIVAESMEAYAQEYIKQTSSGKDAEIDQTTDINSYAEAYINHISKNGKISSPIITDDINEYANEYIKRQLEGNFEN